MNCFTVFAQNQVDIVPSMHSSLPKKQPNPINGPVKNQDISRTVKPKESKTQNNYTPKKKKIITDGYVENFKISSVGNEDLFYNGYIKNNKLDGRGKLYTPIYHTLVYDGEFKLGKRDGNGTEYYSYFKCVDKVKYIGQFKDDLYEGEGVYYPCEDNTVVSVRGQYQHGKYVFGKYELKNGDQFEANFEQAANYIEKRISILKYFFANGDIYEGEFSNDKIQGKGIYIWKNNVKYTGEFNNGVLQGKGILNFGSKNYVGFFKRGNESEKEIKVLNEITNIEIHGFYNLLEIQAPISIN